VVALVALAAMLFLGTAIFHLASHQLKQVAYNRDRMVALNLAEAGQDYALWSLYQLGGTAFQGTTGVTLRTPAGEPIGSFDVAVTTPANSSYTYPRQISTMGRSLGLYGRTRAAQSVLTQVHLNLDSVPPSPAFDYALFTDGPMHFKGGGSPSDPIVGNGNVHSNTSITLNNPNHLIVDSNHVVEAPDWPNYPGHIPFPQLDLDYYRQYAQTDPGSHYYFGTTAIAFPTAYDDVVLVEGLSGQTVDLNLSSDAFGQLIVIGGNVRIFGNRRFHGLIYVDQSAAGQGGGYTMTGTSDVYGAVIARSMSEVETELTGTLRIVYDEDQFDDPKLMPPTGPELVSVDSWQEL